MKLRSIIAVAFCLVATYATVCESMSDADISTILTSHNTARARMNAQTMPDLTWDADLAAVAAGWAAQCTLNTHNPDRQSQYDTRTGSTEYVGENIAWAADSGSTPSASVVIKGWFDEEASWAYPNTCVDNAVCGHWTQIIWASTLRVGCASVTSCQYQTYFVNYIVCNYAPGGNDGSNPYVARTSPTASTTPTTTATPTTTSTPTTTTSPQADTTTPEQSTSSPDAQTTPTPGNGASQLQLAIASIIATSLALLL